MFQWNSLELLTPLFPQLGQNKQNWLMLLVLCSSLWYCFCYRCRCRCCWCCRYCCCCCYCCCRCCCRLVVVVVIGIPVAVNYCYLLPLLSSLLAMVFFRFFLFSVRLLYCGFAAADVAVTLAAKCYVGVAVDVLSLMMLLLSLQSAEQ